MECNVETSSHRDYKKETKKTIKHFCIFSIIFINKIKKKHKNAYDFSITLEVNIFEDEPFYLNLNILSK